MAFTVTEADFDRVYGKSRIPPAITPQNTSFFKVTEDDFNKVYGKTQNIIQNKIQNISQPLSALTQTAGETSSAVSYADKLKEKQTAQKYGLIDGKVKLPSSVENQGLYTSFTDDTKSQKSDGIRNIYENHIKLRKVDDKIYTKRKNDISKGLAYMGKIETYFPDELSFGTSHDGESLIKMTGFRDNDRPMGFFRAHTPHNYNGKTIGYHINTLKNAEFDMVSLTPLQEKTLRKLSHIEIPESAYNLLKDFSNISEDVKNIGKSAAVLGTIFDTYELGKTVYEDLNDKDGKLGYSTAETILGIGGSWIGSAAGTKLGTVGGAAVGTAICPGLGTVIGGFIGGSSGGIIGSTAGRKLGEAFVTEIYRE